MTGHLTADGERGRARRDYIEDQLQHVRTTTDHAALLRKRAPERIKAATDALGAVPAQADANDLARYHAVERLLDERAFYPPHDKRNESPAYAKVHHQMTVVDDKHCLVCGVQNSTLGDAAANPFGAVQMETHHHTVEWALANAVDPAKFNGHIRPGLRRQAEARRAKPDHATLAEAYTEFDDLYQADMTAEAIRDWVDHAADNLWVLCDVHHRHRFVGIHAITYPIWGPQDVVDAVIVAKQIEAAQAGGA